MSVNSINTSYSALQANQLRVDVAANNMANVNTENFQASSVRTADAAYINDIGQGTRVSATYANPRSVPATASTEGQTGAASQSNTDPVTETTNMMAARSAYDVNVTAGRTANEMTQSLIDVTG